MSAIANSPGVRGASAARPAHLRNAVTNGRRLHVVPPGDGKWARRFADVLRGISADLGGPNGLSEMQRQLARRATMIAIACERMEGEAAAGREIDLELYGSLVDRLGRCFARLGLPMNADGGASINETKPAQEHHPESIEDAQEFFRSIGIDPKLIEAMILFVRAHDNSC
jgi:hypothetical protein